MVVSPYDTKKLTKREKQAVQKLEEMIDDSLMHGERTIGAEGMQSIRVRDELMRMYRDAGWKIDYVYDPRDGDYINFSEYRQPNAGKGENHA